MQAIRFTLGDIQKPKAEPTQTEIAVKLTGEPSAPEPVTFGLADIVPTREATVGDDTIQFPGTFSDAEIQRASQETYGKPAQLADGGVMGLLKNFWEEVNPRKLMAGISGMVSNEGGSALDAAVPIIGVGKKLASMASGAGQAQEAVFRKAQEAADKGDYVTATRHFINYLIPLVGPGIDERSDQAQAGDIAGSIGGSLGIGTMNLAPVGIAKAQSIRVPVAPKSANPITREAVDFALSEGIPVTPATATGNPVLLGAQSIADNTSLAGSYIGQRAAQAHDAALATSAQRQAARAYPSPVTAEQAGHGVREAVRATRDRFSAEADTAYSALRKIEEQATPTTVTTTVQGRVAGGGEIPVGQTAQVRMAVDVGAVKSALMPFYEALQNKLQHTGQLLGVEGRANTALGALLKAPDKSPLSVVDAALSDLKDLARVPSGALASKGQAQFKFIVDKLDEQVRAAARREGPAAIRALEEGRRATKAKHAANDIYEAIKAEPVSVFRQTTAAGDSAIAQLREIAKLAPSELPKIGRAYLDSLLDMATKEGGFNKAQKVYAAWDKLGAETKKLLFADAQHVKDLDNFFLYAKKAAENANPSRSGYIGGLLAHGYFFRDPISGLQYEIAGAALSAALHSPKTTRVLLNGLRIPLGNKTGAAAAAANLMKEAKELPGGLQQFAGNPSQDSPPR